MDSATWYFDRLLAADTEGIAAAFAGEPQVDDPRAGHVAGRAALAHFVAESAAWLAGWAARVEPVALTATAERAVAEVILHLDLPTGPWGLPVAVVADRDPAGLRAIRVYHSLWPLTGGHAVRPPLLPPDPQIRLTGAPAAYQAALAAGDLPGILAAYEPDATVREPSGGPYTFQGTDQIRRIYTLQFAAGGGIPLQHCTATDDGTACAIEYNAVRWGRQAIPPQAGVAVYVRGRSGRLAASRIYDDVDPPAVSDSSRQADAPTS